MVFSKFLHLTAVLVKFDFVVRWAESYVACISMIRHKSIDNDNTIDTCRIDNTVKHVLRDHALLAEHTFQYNWTCHQRPPVLRDHIFVANGVVFQDRFYCTHTYLRGHWLCPTHEYMYSRTLLPQEMCSFKTGGPLWQAKLSESCGLSRQVVSDGSGLSRWVSLY